MNRIVSYELSPHEASRVFVSLSYPELLNLSIDLGIYKKSDIKNNQSELQSVILKRVRQKDLVDRFIELLSQGEKTDG